MPAAPAGPGRRGTVLITGATGAVGPHIVRWLAAEGAERIVLAGRRGEDAPGAAELAAELAGSGAEVLPVACDVTDRPALDRLRDELAASGPPVRTVVHAAAHIALAPLAGCSLDEFARVIEAKAAGARNLDEVFDDSVDEFVLFSSIAGVWGSGDHGAYAAANAYLDALAENRRARGLPATSVAWGVWNTRSEHDRDNKPDAAEVGARLRRQGLPPMPPDRALAGLGRALAGGDTAIAIADVDWERFLPVFTSVRPSALLTEIADREARRGHVPAGSALAGGAAEPGAGRRPHSPRNWRDSPTPSAAGRCWSS